MDRAFKAFLGLLFLAQAPASLQAGEITGSAFSFRDWSGAGYFDADTGHFTNCAVSAAYRSGDYLIFSINIDATISILLGNESWNLRVGQEFNVMARVDRRVPFYGTAVAVSKYSARLIIPEFDRALRDIQKGYWLTISTNEWTGSYSLQGTFGALEEAKQCVLRYLDYPRVASHRSAQSGPQSARPAQATIDPAILYQLATAMISEAQIADFKYLTEEEKVLFGLLPSAVYWRSPSAGILAGVNARAVPAGTSLSAISAQDVHTIAGGCSGDFITGSRAIQRANFPGREVHSVCASGDSSFEVFQSSTLVGETLVEVLLYFSGERGSAEQDNQRLSDRIGVRTANFVAEISS